MDELSDKEINDCIEFAIEQEKIILFQKINYLISSYDISASDNIQNKLKELLTTPKIEIKHIEDNKETIQYKTIYKDLRIKNGVIQFRRINLKI